MQHRDWAFVFSERGDVSPLHLLVIQPTPFCNIDCRYCYLADRQHVDRMSVETFQTILERLAEAGLYGEELTILWHGGEPLSVPLDFYRDAFALCARVVPSECRFRFNFQTNATLISDEFCSFVREIDAHVGISIDGPEDLTDAARVYRNGVGTYHRVMRGVARLKAHGITFSAICVLRSASLDHAERIFDFFATLGADQVGFNIEEVEGIHQHSTLFADTAASARLKEFMRLIHRRWKSEAPHVQFRDLHQVERALRFGTEVFSRLVNPFSIVSVAWDGGWSTFAPELLYDERFRFGNVNTSSFEAALLSTAFDDAYTDIAAGVAKCRAECDYFRLCGGGCPSNKLAETGSTRISETKHCQLSRKALIDVTLDELERSYALT